MSYAVVSNGDGSESVYTDWVWVCSEHPNCPSRHYWDTGINPPDFMWCSEDHPITKKTPR
jgi:hypothetical protein